MSILTKNNLMREAITLAMQGMQQNNGGPFGCIIVQDGLIIGRGNNRVTITNDPTAHAEIVAIREACLRLGSFQLDDCEIYASCEPCPMCLGAIYWARPKKVYYACTRHDAALIGFDDEFIYNEIALSPDQRSIVMEQIMRDEAMKVFESWRLKEDKMAY
ncbi:MAG TPA: nucleoside deaminase [Saprospiraceae bacterium]|nr:nucleoside deaminase [Saprospiraceae bacterium]